MANMLTWNHGSRPHFNFAEEQKQIESQKEKYFRLFGGMIETIFHPTWTSSADPCYILATKLACEIHKFQNSKEGKLNTYL